ncbi:hypothetical protein RvY_13018 [Ramazzottius varieornatus]|uniref:Uncharacterized protein n=1 Tax=Ramazzottius varieornatus TaxID=947166 RepID=A0A1D1VLF7_RAMVA|nr:hypothetical protein RvY_13018 [Ramazzottius varieornatus]
MTGMSIAPDYSHITTVGTDGNILVFQLKVPNTEEAISERRYYKSILHTLQTTQLTVEEDKAFSLFVREDRLMRDQAEQAQENMKEHVRKIRLEVINRIMEDNERLPEEMRLTKEDFILTPQVRASVEGDFTRRLKNARNTNIVERVKGRIVEERLIEYVRHDTERGPEFRLKSFDGTCHASTYWIQQTDYNLSQQISQLKVDLERQLQEDKCRAAADAEGCPVEFGSYDDQPVEQQILKNGPVTITNHDQRLSAMGRHTWERLPYAEHLRRTKQRWEQWKRLLDRKPDVSQDGDQVLASERKRISGQEYKIKQKEEYAIQFMAEYLHAPQVQLEFLELRQRVHEYKKKFNSRLVDLRAEKVVRIGHYRQLVTELEKLQEKLLYSEQVSLEPVDDLDKEEEPEGFQKPSREECMEVYNKEEQEKKKKEKHVARNSLIDEEQHVGLAEDVNSKKPRFARLQSFATRQGRLSLLERPVCEMEPPGPWDELHAEPSPEEEFEERSRMSLLLYQRDKLVESAKNILKVFDGKLKLLRHDKFMVDIELKRAELHLLIYQWEYRILKGYDDHERMLSREEVKLEAKKRSLEARLRSLYPGVRAVFDRLQHMREKEASVKLEFEKYWKTVMQHKPLRRLLYNVFIYKIKGLQLDDGENEGCAYNPEVEEPAVEANCSTSSMGIRNRANLKRSSLRWKSKLRLGSRGMKKPSLGPSLTDFDPMDVHTCPRGLDKKVFLTVQSLNKQYTRLRNQIDDDIDHHQALLGQYQDTAESLSHVTFELANVSASLHELRLEKFNRWKEIPYPVAVRMDQFRFGNNNVDRSEIYEALVFDERNLQLLQSFIDQVKRETMEDTGQLANLKNQYDKLDREQILFALRTDALRKECQKLMVEKYGGFIDLDRAEQLRTDAGIRSLEDELVKKQKTHDRKMHKLKQDAEDLRVELTKTRADTTVFLKSVSSQMAERELLSKRIKDRAKKTGRGVLENVTTEGLQTHHEKLLLWQHIAQVQAAEIDSLLTEISFFKSKDSDVGVLRNVLDRHVVDNFGDHNGRFPTEELPPLSAAASTIHEKTILPPVHSHRDLPAEAQHVHAAPPAHTVETKDLAEDGHTTLTDVTDVLSSLDFSFISYLPIFADGSFTSVVEVPQNAELTSSEDQSAATTMASPATVPTSTEDQSQSAKVFPEDQPPPNTGNDVPRVVSHAELPIGY